MTSEAFCRVEASELSGKNISPENINLVFILFLVFEIFNGIGKCRLVLVDRLTFSIQPDLCGFKNLANVSHLSISLIMLILCAPTPATRYHLGGKGVSW